MKIAIVSDAIYPYNKGGKEKRIYETSIRLARLGHEVNIYCMKWWKEGPRSITENGVKLHALSAYYPLYKNDKRSIKQAVLFGLSCFKLVKEDFDVIDADHMPHLILFPIKVVSKLKRKKMIATWNEVWGKDYWVEYMGVLGYLSSFIEKLSVLMPDMIISISDHTTRKLREELKSKKQIVTIPMGINASDILKIAPSSTKSDVIFAGRLLKNKNVDVLINSIADLAKKNPQISCFIIGEGPEKKNLMALVKKLKLEKNITFLDFLPNHDELYSFFKSSKVFVLPSTREGFGIVVLEANGCGIPAITTNHKDNGAKDLINGVNGLTVELSVPSLSAAIEKLIKSRGNALDYINFAKKYDWENITNKTLSAYLL